MYACKLICNLYKEHWILENSCVTPSFPSLSSLLFFLFNIFFPCWAITHSAGCVAASVTWHTDRQMYRDQHRQHPEQCLSLRFQSFIQPRFLTHLWLSPHQNLASKWPDWTVVNWQTCWDNWNMLRLGHLRKCAGFFGCPAYVDSWAGLQVCIEWQTVVTLKDAII